MYIYVYQLLREDFSPRRRVGMETNLSPCSRDVNRGQTLEAEVEAEAKFNRPSPRPKLKRPNRTVYFTMKIYA